MFYQIKSYLAFLRKAKRKHGVHSPFVYEFANTCFYKTPEKTADERIKNYRKQLVKNTLSIDVQDFGAGSKSMTTKERKIAAIAKHAGISVHRAHVLNRIVRRINAATVLEIGTSLGIGTASMAFQHPHTKIVTLEGCPQTANIAQQQFNAFGLDTIQLELGPFEKTLLPTLQNHSPFDLIFFDGNHQKEATLQYFELCLSNKHDNTVFIFDDIYWSRGMTEAWEQIKRHPDVTVTIDTFYWGIVFFRKGQARENFVLKMK
ncbi:class I SAM-dependent methyltransferase [Flavobacteriaceae bacterium F08102]|nr:class I SAM-dependent methyltransferase [Flavobacteriaceae bacterium F08102]